jgi:hypothetical protein
MDEIMAIANEIKDGVSRHGQRLAELETLVEAMQPRADTHVGAPAHVGAYTHTGARMHAGALAQSMRACMGLDEQSAQTPFYEGVPGELKVPLSALTPGDFEDTRIGRGFEPLRVSRVLSHPAISGSAMAVQLPDDSGQLRIPVLSGGAATFLAENAAMPALGETSAHIDMAGRRIGAHVKLPSNIVSYADLSTASELIRRAMQSAFGELLDKTLTGITAVTNGPVAMTGTTAVASGTNGQALNRASLEVLLDTLETNNYTPGAWIMSHKASRKLQATESFSGSTEPLLANGMLLGLPVVESNAVPQANSKGSGSNLQTIWLGDFANLLIGYWRTATVRVGEIADDRLTGRLTATIEARLDMNLSRASSVTRQDHFIV